MDINSIKKLKMGVWLEIDYSLLVVGVEREREKMWIILEWKGVWSNEHGLKGKEEAGHSCHKVKFNW